MASIAPDVATESCHACGRRTRGVRHSDVWNMDVARCGGCGTVSVVGAAAIVADDLRTAATGGEVEETDWEVYSETMHTAEAVRHDVLDELRARVATAEPGLRLFDVGAGTGGFLDMARSRGFRIAGNDISRSAIAHAAARYGIELSSADLHEQPPRSVDAITLWCVIAHVGDPRALLASAWRMLRPGGVLFLRTPRWCAADAVGSAVARASGGRVTRLVDQRVTRGHLHLYRDRGMAQLLTNVGFTDVEVRPVVHTGCTGAEIASRLGGPRRVQGLSARVIDRAMSSGIAPRNTMFVYARRPSDHAPLVGNRINEDAGRTGGS